MKKNKTIIRQQLELLNNRLRLYLEAEKAILSGQSYRVEGLELTRPDLENVQNMIRKLQNDICFFEIFIAANSNKHSRIIRPRW